MHTLSWLATMSCLLIKKVLFLLVCLRTCTNMEKQNCIKFVSTATKDRPILATKIPYYVTYEHNFNAQIYFVTINISCSINDKKVNN